MRKREFEAISRRVERGAARLDKDYPGWHRKVLVTQLDLESGYYLGGEDCGCVLAQLDGVNYSTRPYARRWSERFLTALGFLSPTFWRTADEAEYYAVLTEKWKEAIRVRRSA